MELNFIVAVLYSLYMSLYNYYSSLSLSYSVSNLHAAAQVHDDDDVGDKKDRTKCKQNSAKLNYKFAMQIVINGINTNRGAISPTSDFLVAEKCILDALSRKQRAWNGREMADQTKGIIKTIQT